MPSSSDLSEPIKRSHDICFEPTLTENNQINGILMRQNTITPVICLHTTPRRRLSEREAGALAQIAEHDHVIELEPGKVPRYKPLYNLSEK